MSHKQLDELTGTRKEYLQLDSQQAVMSSSRTSCLFLSFAAIQEKKDWTWREVRNSSKVNRRILSSSFAYLIFCDRVTAPTLWKLFFEVVFPFFIEKSGLFVTFRAQPLSLISLAGTGSVELARTGWILWLSLYHILALSNKFSFSGTSQHEPHCKWFFSNYLSVPLSDAKVERLRKYKEFQSNAAYHYFLRTARQSIAFRSLWWHFGQRDTSIMLNKKNK